MTDPSQQSLEEQLSALRHLEVPGAAARIEQGLRRQANRRRRELIAALTGAVVAGVGAAVLIARGESAAAVLILAVAVLVAVAVRAGRAATSLGAAAEGASMLAAWRAALARQQRHAFYSVVHAALFVALTLAVLWRHGLSDWRPLVYLAVTLVVTAFAAYQWLIVRPALAREEVMLRELE